MGWLRDLLVNMTETVKAYENVMRLVPTDKSALMEYSQALFCNEEIEKAHIVLQRLNKWHPNHRFSVLAQLREAQALGNYEAALISLKQLLNQGYLYHDETKLARAVFFDLGYPELALPHVRFPPAQAHVHAMMDNKEAALESAEVISNFYTSIRARMIVETDYFPEDYSEYSTYSRVGEPNIK